MIKIKDNKKNLIIIGAGPAGLAAAIYAARYKLDFLVFSKQFGGMITESDRVENWPGEKIITGIDLMGKFKEHAVSLGAKIIEENVETIEKTNSGFKVNNNYESKKILIAQGTEKRRLNVEGEKEFIGKGVSYCATCDGAFFKNKTACVAGGNNSAAIAALLLSEFADKVYIIYRREKIRAEPIWVERIKKNSKITIINNTKITKIKGDNFVKSVLLDNDFNNSKELNVDGVFVEIGSEPNTKIASQLGVELENGYIKTDAAQHTNIKGVYAAGDITTGSNKFEQLITAGAEGAVAANAIYEELKKGNK